MIPTLVKRKQPRPHIPRSASPLFLIAIQSNGRRALTPTLSHESAPCPGILNSRTVHIRSAVHPDALRAAAIDSSIFKWGNAYTVQRLPGVRSDMTGFPAWPITFEVRQSELRKQVVSIR